MSDQATSQPRCSLVPQRTTGKFQSLNLTSKAVHPLALSMAPTPLAHLPTQPPAITVPCPLEHAVYLKSSGLGKAWSLCQKCPSLSSLPVKFLCHMVVTWSNHLLEEVSFELESSILWIHETTFTFITT